jgi:integrase
VSITHVVAGDGHRCAPTKGEVWCVTVNRLDGSPAHRHRRSAAAARTLARQLGAEEFDPKRGRRTGALPQTKTLRDYSMKRWLPGHRTATLVTLPDGTRTGYQAWKALQRVFPRWGDLPLEEFDSALLLVIQAHLLDHYARNTVTETMTYLKRVLRQAAADRRIPFDPTIGVRMPARDAGDRGGIVTAEDVPTHAEAVAIIAAAPARGRVGVVLGFGTGMRVGEILGVTPFQHALAEAAVRGRLTVDEQEADRGRVKPKTFRGDRTIDIASAVDLELRRASRGLDPHDLLITGPRSGRRMMRSAFYRQVWYPALDAARVDGKPLTRRYKFHATRHYAVSMMLARGVTTAEVAAYVGDREDEITSTYSHWLRGSKGLATGALDAALGPVEAPPVGEADAVDGDGR